MRLPSVTASFAILMVVSAVSAFLVPADWTQSVRSLFQVVAFGQWPASTVSRQAREAVDRVADEKISQERARELMAENARLVELVTEQQLSLEGLQRQLDTATGLRDQMPGSHARLVLAPIVAYDANPRRATLQIALNENTRPLVRKDQWVAAAVWPRTGEDQPIRQWLVGRIGEVQPRLARVILTTDPEFHTEVRVGRLLPMAGGRLKLEIEDEGCVLDGRGGGKMIISLVRQDYAASGARIVVAPASKALPSPLILGRIESSKRRDDSTKHYDLLVTPWGALESLTHVYVISTEQ